jgi:quercetin dioxygenase-like cupin family protein
MNAKETINLINHINYSTDSVVSKTLVKQPTGTVTLFAFDKGQALSKHTAPFDALVQVLDGSVNITIGDEDFALNPGDAILMPANVPHALEAVARFKMLLTMIKE